MRIAIYGASGYQGRLVLAEALARIPFVGQHEVGQLVWITGSHGAGFGPAPAVGPLQHQAWPSVAESPCP